MSNDLLDNDLYKFTMQQAVCQLYPRAHAEYRLIFRDDTRIHERVFNRIQSHVRALKFAEIDKDGLEFLRGRCSFFNPVYLDLLRRYQYDAEDPRIEMDWNLYDGHMELVYRGPWYYTILWEVPLMAVISETFFEFSGSQPRSSETNKTNNIATAKLLRGLSFADFGTRRRYSEANHEQVLKDILSVSGNSLVGTSNVRFAKRFNLKPIGTMAHEWIMFHGAINGYQRANYSALESWTQVYRGDLGIALTDTFTTDVFLRTFDTYHAKLFDGVRHDSGDPFEFASKTIRHYEKLGIDPKTKTIVFSDGLNAGLVRDIANYCHNRIKVSFGIGTSLTNNVGVKPLNMVIKMTRAKLTEDSPWVPTVKLSDFETKHTGDPDQVELCKKVLGV